jgi:hypothetical protein
VIDHLGKPPLGTTGENATEAIRIPEGLIEDGFRPPRSNQPGLGNPYQQVAEQA